MGTNVQMSTNLIGIGQRMLSVRSELGYPQNKVAAILGIADKSYKNYELEKREIPLSIAVKFCEEFEKSLTWLIHGTTVPSLEESARLAGKTAKAIFHHSNASRNSFSSAEFEKFSRYIFEQAASKGASPEAEAKLFFSTIE